MPPENCYLLSWAVVFQREAASAAERNDSLIWALCGMAGV